MLKQIWVTVLMGLGTITQRRGASLVIVIGMLCAIGALVSIQSISAGVDRMMHSNGRPDRAIVLSRNAVYEQLSSLSRDAATTIADAPGVKHDADGKPITSAEAQFSVSVPKKSDGLNAFIAVRGIGPKALALRPEIRLISGRMFRPGKYEVIVGKSAADQFGGLTEGSRIALPDGDWNIVGTFESNGSMLQSALLTDANTLMSSARATNYKSVTVMLTSPQAFKTFKNALTANPTLTVDPELETAFNERQSRHQLQERHGDADLAPGVQDVQERAHRQPHLDGGP